MISFLLMLGLLFSVLGVQANELPDLGDASQAVLTPQQERRIGEQVVRDFRARDPAYLDDPELSDYLNTLGARLVSVGPDARQDFEFFPVRDSTLNAFALPGGFIGVHTGLIQTTQSEAELASVLAHEIGHVTQHHMARSAAKQAQIGPVALAAMAVAILAARSNPQLGNAAVISAQAGALQMQLSYTRELEREADRVGLQILVDAGFDARAMASFFERMQKSNRFAEGNAPAYLRTHPLTAERISDIENRVLNMSYRQSVDSLEFQLVRARIRARFDAPKDAVHYFETLLREQRAPSEAAANYGIAVAQFRLRDYVGARKAIQRAMSGTAASPMLETLLAEIEIAAGDTASATSILQRSLARYPTYRPLSYAYLDLLNGAGRSAEAAVYAQAQIQLYSQDVRLHQGLARAYAGQNKTAAQYRAQAEVFALQGNLGEAVQQLQLAQKARDADFYESSAIDARLKQLRQLRAEEIRQR